MASWFRRLAPLLVWAAFLLGYGRVVDVVGDYAQLLGLAAVALSGWLWGAVGGMASGVLGYLAIRVVTDGLGIVPWRPPQLLEVEQAFAFVAYAGTGLVIGWSRQLERNLRHERAVSQRALVDPLTGALVRAAFEERLRFELDKAAEAGDGLALLFVDLDRFKFVNDTYGHDTGDKLLIEVGKVLLGNVRANDLVGRVGGDEFMVALLGVKDEGSAGQIARALVRELGAPFAVEGRELQVSASIGVSLFPRDGSDTEALLHSADAAMYQVKQGGKNAYHFSTVEVRTRLSRRLELERELRRALSENELEIVYQPQVSLGDESLMGFEALLRWHSRTLGQVSPGEFVPVAEEAGLIAAIGHWTLRESALQLRAWQRLGIESVRVSVNASTLQFHQPNFYDTVKGAIDASGIAPEAFGIEVTESVLVRDHELAVRTLRRLERLGVGIALDDFGTGYSSLAYLQRMPINTLKIDKSFIMGLTPEPIGSATRSTDGRSGFAIDPTGAAPIVEAICAMAHKLGKQVVAEGVETAFQRTFLRRLGVDLAQGYFFARPMKPVQVEDLLRRVIAERKAADTVRGPGGPRLAGRPPARRAPTLWPGPASGADPAATGPGPRAAQAAKQPAAAAVGAPEPHGKKSLVEQAPRFDDLLIWE